jgi:CRP-like cAMP-binding protein
MKLSARSLSQYSLFGGLPEAAIDYLLQYMGQVNFRAGEKIFSEGDTGDEICFIVKGKVQVEKSGVVLAEMGEGEQFGEMYVIDIMPRSADVVGLESGSLIRISHRNLGRLRQKDPEAFTMLLLNCSRDISRRLRRLNDRFVEQRDA